MHRAALMVAEKRHGFKGRSALTRENVLAQLSPEQPVLIAGPTASGKNALALAIARQQGGVVVNADAIQVFANWRVLTARPSPAEEASTPHALYGHVAGERGYSVGQWLRDIRPVLAGTLRPIITGGSGLYFQALTAGLAEIPPLPPDLRLRGQRLLQQEGLRAVLAGIDAKTLARLDTRNPMRVLRAWEVYQGTGRGLVCWHRDTPRPLLPLSAGFAVVLEVDPRTLEARITQRLEQMLRGGALEEARANRHDFVPSRLSSKAIGAAELIAHIEGKLPLAQARQRILNATRQLAKRQRSWFRSKMKDWQRMRSD